ncbi:MAG: zinc ABC transporter substrate-binding protein [Deltaproteobacteria bacterium]|nr:zinc ABC transporter substrate-binding protein [Deltaproteobacteria bacterium]
MQLRGVLSVFMVLIAASDAGAVSRMPVFVSIAPQKYFVEKIGGDLVDIHTMVSPGASPATYEPKPRQMAALTKAKVYFAIGVPFENRWLPKIAAASPLMEVIHTDHGIVKIPMQPFHHRDSEKQHPKSSTPKRLDPHIWLSPKRVKIQAQHILNTFIRIDSLHRSIYITQYHQFIRELEDLDAEIQQKLAGEKGRQFMIFHPSWGYFAHEYGLEQIAVEIEGKDPKSAQLKALIQQAKSKGIKVIFMQRQFSAKSARMVARAIGGRVVFLDPLAPNWADNLRTTANAIKSGLK